MGMPALSRNVNLRLMWLTPHFKFYTASPATFSSVSPCDRIGDGQSPQSNGSQILSLHILEMSGKISRHVTSGIADKSLQRLVCGSPILSFHPVCVIEVPRLLTRLFYFSYPSPCAPSEVPPLFLFGMSNLSWSSAKWQCKEERLLAFVWPLHSGLLTTFCDAELHCWNVPPGGLPAYCRAQL